MGRFSLKTHQTHSFISWLSTAALTCALLLTAAGGSLSRAAQANVDQALVTQLTPYDCGPSALYNALMLSSARSALLQALANGSESESADAYKKFLQRYGKTRFKQNQGTELKDLAAMGNDAMKDLLSSDLLSSDLVLTYIDFPLSQKATLEFIYNGITQSFDKGLDPVLGIAFRSASGKRLGGHAVMVYKVAQFDNGLVISYLDPQDLSLGELFVSEEGAVTSNTLYSNTDEASNLWTLDGIIAAR